MWPTGANPPAAAGIAGGALTQVFNGSSKFQNLTVFLAAFINYFVPHPFDYLNNPLVNSYINNPEVIVELMYTLQKHMYNSKVIA